ncbi:Scr1 family TA system antitoxin-like transcriptional regulator [Streptomyces sp. NPDC058603]|uniref:Scr1 family TA system antitoxin-like transcriptional regulator n=1 Tax=Streptomyces sp. NPDC058603 TaxID=3346551 RepID=UPI003646033A
MPPRSSPTERQRRLGAELRKMRLAAGMTTEFAAGLLEVPRTNVPNMESGRSGLSVERVRTLSGNYGCEDKALVDALAAMAMARGKGWWERYRGVLPEGLLDIAELEWHATRLSTLQTVHLPGLLHLSEYARAVFTAVLPPLPASDVELRVAHRLERQRVLDLPDPVRYAGYVHEAALRMQFGGRRATREQLRHLCAMSERENIELRILPVQAGAFPGAGHAVLYAEGPVSQLDTVQLDSAHGPVFSHAEGELVKYRAHFAWMETHALSTAQSRDFIHGIAHEL